MKSQGRPRAGGFRPGRPTRGAGRGAFIERGRAVKDPGGRVSVALVWPGGYREGMSSLGFMWIYAILNSRTDALAERVFLPADPKEPVRSLETGRELPGFDLVAGSLSWENDYWIFLEILRRGGMDPERSGREARGGPARPLVCAGGVGVWANPWGLFPFADLIFSGEGEIAWEAIADVCSRKGFAGLAAEERTRILSAAVPGCLAPGLLPRELTGSLGSGPPAGPDDPVAMLKALREFAPVVPPRLSWPFPAEAEPPRSTVWAPGAGFSGMRLVELSRGCPHGCRFCLAGQLYLPHRPWPADRIIEALTAPNPWTGEDPFPADAPAGLVSPAAADHPEFEGILEALAATGRRASFSSLRLSALTERAARLLGEAGLKGAAVAPEGGTEALRARANKNLTDDRIIEGARILAAAGLRSVKLYFMFGLPGETDGDLAAAAELAFRIRRELGAKGRGPAVAASFSCFVPKPHTAFEDEPLLGEPEIRRRGELLKKLLPPSKGVELRLEPARAAVIEGVISRGGPEAGRLVRALLETGGRQGPALKLAGIDGRLWLFSHLTPDSPRPWRVIAPPAGIMRLADESEKARSGIQSPPCPPGGGCGMCGGCAYLEGR